jgi:hypothetical protein
MVERARLPTLRTRHLPADRRGIIVCAWSVRLVHGLSHAPRNAVSPRSRGRGAHYRAPALPMGRRAGSRATAHGSPQPARPTGRPAHDEDQALPARHGRINRRWPLNR